MSSHDSVTCFLAPRVRVHTVQHPAPLSDPVMMLKAVQMEGADGEHPPEAGAPVIFSCPALNSDDGLHMCTLLSPVLSVCKYLL